MTSSPLSVSCPVSTMQHPYNYHYNNSVQMWMSPVYVYLRTFCILIQPIQICTMAIVLMRLNYFFFYVRKNSNKQMQKPVAWTNIIHYTQQVHSMGQRSAPPSFLYLNFNFRSVSRRRIELGTLRIRSIALLDVAVPQGAYQCINW